MSDDFKILPRDIYAYLATLVLGQEQVLKKVSVAVYRHINGFKAGNLLLIGSSGTGKTTIMNAVESFYDEYRELKKYKAMTIMNANMLVNEEKGEVNTNALMKNLEIAVNNSFGLFVQEAKLKEYMENATVCIDEVDKITAKISGKTNVSGITAQHALLTLIEGERVLYETVRGEYDKKKVSIPLNTSKMLFICGGAFEGIHDLIVERLIDQKQEALAKEFAVIGDDGRIHDIDRSRCNSHLTMTDLFNFGMMPQFISRFKTMTVLEDLGVEELKRILLTSERSPLRDSREYFRSMGIDLRITSEAVDLIAVNAVKNTRIGARALIEVFSRIIADFEYDPESTDKVKLDNGKPILTIDRDMVQRALEAPLAKDKSRKDKG